jgi:glycosyltransferase involved in cell wall biosynthesis
MIDIIIPAYNREDTIGRTLSSLAAQTDTDFNVIIVDDCSTDNTQSVAESFKNLLNIKYIRNEKNLGPGDSRQVGLDNSTSKFVAFLDSDDMFMPHTVETFNTAIKANSDIEFLYTYFYEQTYVEGVMSLVLWKDNMTALHGKLYNIDIIRKYNIRFVPGMIWSEDAYFNSICTELMQMTVLKVPTMIWTFNKNSWVRGKNPERDKVEVDCFIEAMKLSCDFVKQYKSNINHIEHTVKAMLQKTNLSEDNKKELNKLLERGQ